jgi:hypothetical protein
MIRWLRAAAVIAVVLAILGVGSVIGLLAVANSGYVAVQPHPWLRPVLDPLLGARVLEVQVPVLLAGWLVAILSASALVVGTMRFAWRRRQHESLIARLERELVRLRNLPITSPAPLEDLPERPDAETARELELARRQHLGLPGGVLPATATSLVTTRATSLASTVSAGTAAPPGRDGGA